MDILKDCLKAAASAFVLGALVGGPAVAADGMAPEELIEALKEGGLVVYIRHGQTESDYADQVTADPLDCSTQRTLSEQGWLDAKAIGAGFREADIPVARVIASQYCRAWQTADLAFDEYTRNPALNFEPAEEYTEEQFAAMRDRVLPLLTTNLPESGNLVVVGHDDPFEAVTGIYPEPQGVTFVLRPEGDRVEVLGHIPPAYWRD